MSSKNKIKFQRVLKTNAISKVFQEQMQFPKLSKKTNAIPKVFQEQSLKMQENRIIKKNSFNKYKKMIYQQTTDN